MSDYKRNINIYLFVFCCASTTGKETTERTKGKFDPALPPSKSFLQVYNCNDEKPPRKKVMPAEKAVSQAPGIF